ncbi:MAG: CAP domain-containing protein [Bacillota bacterium]|nr:CAP domain-containing protein [Bacillota bacterium]
MIKKICIGLLSSVLISTTVMAQPINYTVQNGDSMWKIAVKYEVGVDEIIAENKNITNPSIIYPGQVLKVPTINDVKALESEVIRLVNVERQKAGLPALSANWELCRVARYKSQDMINKHYFSHTSPTYGSPFQMMESFGIKFSSAGENIAYGQKTPAEVMTCWMNSSGHRSNILSPSYTQIGVGLAKDSNGVCYWTQQFIRPM